MNLLVRTIYKEVAVYFVLLISIVLIGNAVDLTFQLLLAVMTLLAFFFLLQLMAVLSDGLLARRPLPMYLTPSSRALIKYINRNKDQIGELKNNITDLEEESRDATATLIRSQKAFRDSLSALPDALIALDRNNRIEWWNDAASTLFGLANALDKNKRIEVVIDNERFRAYASNPLSNQSIEIPSPLTKDKIISIQIVQQGTDVRLLQARDETHLRQLEQVRRDFIANTSHELRTPLTVIHGYIETLMDNPPTEGSQTLPNALTAMYRQTSRIKGIVEDMLMLSRLEQDTQTTVETVDMVRLLETARDEAEILSGSQQHKLTLDIQTGFLLVGNQEQIRSLVANLVSNAIRYTPEGGEITLRWWIDDNGAYFTVSDTGIGIEPDQISRITERFYRVDVARSRETGGTGLGLAIVKHVLTRLGGELSISSRPGVGSTFTCLFPRLAVRRASKSELTA